MDDVYIKDTNYSISSEDVTVVTVTYGRSRSKLLREMCAAVRCNGVGRLVVVDNGSAFTDVRKLKEMQGEVGDSWLHVVRLQKNTGSANGYAVGIQYAMNLGAQYLWLLDDDNAPNPDALYALLQAYDSLCRQHGFEKTQLMLESLRLDKTDHLKLASGVSPCDVFARDNSFLGFHILDVHKKLARRLMRKRADNKWVTVTNHIVPVPWGIYGGLFFHRSVVSSIGLPDVSLYLYGDDTEYTRRFVRSGGYLYLVCGSRIHDLSPSWMDTGSDVTSFRRYLLGDPHRMFYTVRNNAYLDVYYSSRKPIVLLNMFIYCFILACYALVLRQTVNFKLFVTAIRRGRRGILGKYTTPLPTASSRWHDLPGI
ncbi:MAG: glycosyltransferase [Alicyclobacillus macrosporangiidus]|uniref:glycosyltransferase n=1 Tax=Alicyclobacillus macrosporangiidus TaxID=392015 RepID=UPI0026E9F2D3|nr:glycosyltransferase [Alicyclobacillus macrosporangiidus]MCL6598838.1 glycosyltransferase [Alicyclobacillus macrosporangiidus]